MAILIPISLVRSVTDTSMMFMIPIPPTIRLTAAIAPKRAVIDDVAAVTACAISAVSRTMKSLSALGAMRRRSRSTDVMPSITRPLSTPSAADRKNMETSGTPATRL